MDLSTLQTQLAGLGVSLVFDNDPKVYADQLPPQRQYRAALYLTHLQDTRTFLTTTLMGTLGSDYPFVRQALAQGSLLNGLAASLDTWVCNAVETAINAAMATGGPNAPKAYADWFTTSVLDPDEGTYTSNVAAFFATYPYTRTALTQIAQNFRNNIGTACRRIIEDRDAITALFSDRYYGLTLSALSGITSTGSDFHKGGQQVLILTFTTRSFAGLAPMTSTLKVVYKPADLEVDCLIAGESAAINRATAVDRPPDDNGDFMGPSLVEIFNAGIPADSKLGTPQLPTYRILPRSCTRSAPVPVPIRAAYGYIEFLGYSITGMSWGGAFNYYPLGASDYVIFQSQNMDSTVENFYRQAGQLLALAVTFSMGDLHVENVLVTRYQMHLIDLEVSLTGPVSSPAETLLLEFGAAGHGGIDCWKRGNEHSVCVFKAKKGTPPQVVASSCFTTLTYHNRLYDVRHLNLEPVPVNEYWLIQGLQQGMDVLQAVQKVDGFADWFARCGGVLVRVVPYATSGWNAVRRNIYEKADQTAATLPAAVADELLATLTDTFITYQANPQPEPEFLALAAPQAATDLQNFDVPVYYHQIGSSLLLDSEGQVIPVPAQVTVLNNETPRAPVQQPTKIGRDTYYAMPPTTERVQNGKVAALTAAGFEQTVDSYTKQVIALLAAASPPDLGVVV